jgi:hypothetical protein
MSIPCQGTDALGMCLRVSTLQLERGGIEDVHSAGEGTHCERRALRMEEGKIILWDRGTK